MERCAHCQAQLLDYLYDLLEPGQRQAIDEHLEQCGPCRTALGQARGQQSLLATAARLEFAEVQFVPPSLHLPLPAVEAPLELEPATPFHWGRWVAAAAILFLVGGVAIPSFRTYCDYVGQRHEAITAAAQHDEALALARQRLATHENRVRQYHDSTAKLHDQLNKLPVEEGRAFQQLALAENQRQLKVKVVGPPIAEPGRLTNYRIVTTDLNNTPVAAEVKVELLDRDKRKVVYEPSVHGSGVGNYDFAFQPDVPLYPNQNLQLQVLAKRANGSQAPVAAPVEIVRALYVTHLMTDKPMYQLGEKVRFRSLTLDRYSLKPPQEDFHLVYTLKDSSPGAAEIFRLEGASTLMSEKGDLLLGPDQKPIRGMGTGEFWLDPDKLAGGEYTLTVSEAAQRFPPQQRKFRVSKYEPPRLNKELEFGQKSYGLGQEVLATASASLVERKDAVLARRPVDVTIKIDDQWYDAQGKPFKAEQPLHLQTDDKGTLKIRFKLPAQVDKGDAALAVTFDDGGSRETIVRSIPLVLKKLNVEFFPEGGYLVPGVANRIYFQVRTPLDKPAELRGKVLDQDNKVVVDNVQTLNDADHPGANQGMGVFTITPAAGRNYHLQIDEPIGIEGAHALPAAKADAVVLTVPQGVFGDHDSLRVTVRSALPNRSLWVGAYCRGRLMDHQPITIKDGGEASVELKPAEGAGGVYRVTVFEDRGRDGKQTQLVPVAERLVYRAPTEQLHLSITPGKTAYTPGETATASVRAVNEKDQFTPAIVTFFVVDRRVLKLADDKTLKTMPTHFFLGTEVRGPEELEYADFLLTDHPKAKAALDLMLGTQGWRRFAEQNTGDFLKKNKEEKFRRDAEQLVLLNGQSDRRRETEIDLSVQERQALATQFQQRRSAIEQQVQQRNEELVQESALLQQDEEHYAAEATTAFERCQAAVGAVNDLEARFARFRDIALPMLSVFLGLFAVAALVLALLRSLARAVPFYAITAICSALLLVLLVLLQMDGLHISAAGLPSPTILEKQEAQLFTREPGHPTRMTDDEGKAADTKPERTAAPATVPVRPFAMQRMGVAGFGGPGGPVPGPLSPPAAGGKGGGDARNFEKPREMLDGKEDALKGINRFADKMDMDRNRQGGRIDPEAMEQLRKQNLEGNVRPLAQGLDPRNKLRLPRAQANAPQVPRGPGGFPQVGGEPMPMKDQLAQQGPFMVREYAHPRKSASASEMRSDFTETLYWHPALVLPEGKLDNLSFSLCDSVTTFQVTAFAHTLDGRIGAVTTQIESRLPFTLEPKLPLEVTASDRIDVPVSIANNTDKDQTVNVRVRSTGLKPVGTVSATPLALRAEQRTRRLFGFQPTLVEGEAVLEVEGEARGFAADSVRRTIKVVPDGFPIVGQHSDLLEGTARTEIVLPDSHVPGTLRCQVQVYPSTLADLQKGLEALLREPNGCFEQTSTSNYPNLLILNYLKEADLTKPEVEQRARDLLARGYQKLTSFECGPNDHKQGYEWFGGMAPAHEALTAYGLLQFRDMSKVSTVDQAMIERTRHYLMAQKDGKGGFKRNPLALDSFGRAPDHITNAYIVWALTESEPDDDVEKELTLLTTQARDSKDPYFLSLVANSLLNRSKTADALALLKKLAELQKDDGHLEATETSITGSGGRDLQIETTSLAVLAWLKRPESNAAAQKAIKWIGQQRGGYGGFGSTQSTILALKALIAYTRANKKTAEGGTLTLFVDNQRVAQVSFAAGAQEALTLDVADAEKHFKPGKNAVRVEITGKNVFPYTLTWTYQTLKPPSAENCPVRLTTTLDRTTVPEGSLATLNVTVQNTSKVKGQAMTVAIIGLPAGMTLPEDLKQMSDLAKLKDGGTTPGKIAAWEVRGRELILYWRDLAPDHKIDVPIQLIARVPGVYRGPASRAYLYYNADQKCWVEPLQATIQAKE